MYFVFYSLVTKSGIFRKFATGHDISRGLGKTAKRAFMIAASALAFVLLLVFITSSRVTNASNYQQMLTVNNRDFAEDIAELPLSQIPIVDRDTAERLGSRKIGECRAFFAALKFLVLFTQD
jgi:hypothetical protein